MLDADSVIEPGFFAASECAPATGAPAIQARSESSHGRSLVMEAALAAFTLPGNHDASPPRSAGRFGSPARHGHGDPA